ncbi:MAG: carbamoyltransferase HypF [Candidatus Eisenbacteria bacterium]
MCPPARSPGLVRLRLTVRGAVQGVGFRPYVYRLAHGLGLAGWVSNDPRGVVIEAEGPRPACEALHARLAPEAPPQAAVHEVTAEWIAPAGERSFEVRASDAGGARTAVLLPDLATCPECLAESRTAGERRHGYPFTNCTNCGPRFSIMRDLPYDRPNTTMSGFPMCADCAREYADVSDRRFHAQPIACPACGPTLAFARTTGGATLAGAAALEAAATALLAGEIVALKGLGGYQLLCDATNREAVARLRERKARVGKPFALLCSTLDEARAIVHADERAAAELASRAAPIVLLPRRADAGVADGVAPGLSHLGVMLPATVLHHQLCAAVARPLVCTSGNLSDEPIAIGDDEARMRLGAIADAFLSHDRPIERHVDDSVGTFLAGEFRLLRRARGFAPLPVRVQGEWPCVLAVGPHLKNTIALAMGDQVFVSQHIGDLETHESMRAFERVIADFLRLYGARPVAIAHDLHPDYLSTRWALEHAAAYGARLEPVQHHHAHLASCLAEHGETGPALGVSWDGTGYGPDGTVWGGEFLRGDVAAYERFAHLRTFALPGGEAAVRDPRRTAAALLREVFGPAWSTRDDLAVVRAFTPAERGVLDRVMERTLGTPRTSSAGRLFDALAALAGLGERVTFEGEAAMRFENAADPGERAAYPAAVLAPASSGGPHVVDWEPLLRAALDDLARGTPAGTIAARAHAGLARAIAAVAALAGESRVALSGGCFQNRRLVEETKALLETQGHRVLLHRFVPPNDGGISLGQAAVAAARAARND